jgi:hypothetical protein
VEELFKALEINFKGGGERMLDLKQKYFILMMMLMIIVAISGSGFAFSPGAVYTVVLEKMNSDGTLTEVGSTTATADSQGKITFTFTNVPTNPTTHFLVITVKDSNNNVVRRSFVPAPPQGGTTELGVNNLSDKQTDMILQAASLVGSDDPVVIAYGLIFTRSPYLTDSDIQNIAALAKVAIIDGFEAFLRNNGVSEARLTTFKNALAYNANGKDIGDFTALFKSAVDNPAQAEDDMSKAAGLIADIFIDAAADADIDLALILAADDSAGNIAENGAGAQYYSALSQQFQSAINQSMMTFTTRIGFVRLAKEYKKAMTTLNTSGTQVDTFNNAINTLSSSLEALDKKYAKYYIDPENNPMTQQIQQQMDNDYQQVFITFMNAITSTDADVAQMRQNMADALSINESDLPQDVGQDYDYTGQQVNWPIPRVVVTNWVASILSAGGDLTYTRLDDVNYPIPGNITWLEGCSGIPNAQQYGDQQSCESNGGTWASQRTDFSQWNVPPSFAALMGIKEDVDIAEMTRGYLYYSSNPETNGQPTKEQERQAKLELIDTLNTIIGNIGGTINGDTPISLAQKKALVRLMLPPNPH